MQNYRPKFLSDPQRKQEVGGSVWCVVCVVRSVVCGVCGKKECVVWCVVRVVRECVWCMVRVVRASVCCGVCGGRKCQ